NRRSKERQEAYRQLLLLASDELYRWLVEEYEPLEYEVRKVVVDAVRWVRDDTPEIRELRPRCYQMLNQDMIQRFRSELTTLRNPMAARQTLRRSKRDQARSAS